jgi:hypothetical protein
MVGSQFVDLTSANFNPLPPLPETPDTSLPSIKVHSPENNSAYNVNSVPYSITVEKPPSWFNYDPFHGMLSLISYSLDGMTEITLADGDEYYNREPLNFEGTLDGLSEGNHSLEVYVHGVSFYNPDGRLCAPGADYYLDASYKAQFTIDTTPPSISLLSVENKTYDSGNVPLNFAVNEPAQISYCLDEQDNVTIDGNTTLTELSYGSHTLVLYASDMAGNTGTSETVTFTIAKETEPAEPLPTTLILASVVSVAVIGACLIIYFIKIRKRNR